MISVKSCSSENSPLPVLVLDIFIRIPYDTRTHRREVPLNAV